MNEPTNPPKPTEIAYIADWNLAGPMNTIRDLCHSTSLEAGWWKNELAEYDVPDEVFRKLIRPTKIALIHSEVSEMLEGERKDLNDDHLPKRKMAEVEAADIMIRLLDYCGEQNFDIGGALIEKLIYNRTRADHQPEAREAAGGKSF